MQAYAEGFELMHASRVTTSTWRKSPKLWSHGSVVRSWLLELTGRALRGGPGPRQVSRATSKTPAKAAGRSRRRSNEACRPVITLACSARFARARTIVLGEGAGGAAQPVRRPRGEDRPIEQRRAQARRRPQWTLTVVARRAAAEPAARGIAASVPGPCALVIFGGSGDLAHRKLVPALYNLRAARPAAGRLRRRRLRPQGLRRRRGLPRVDARGGRDSSRAPAARRDGLGELRRRALLRAGRLRRARAVRRARRAARRSSTTSAARRATRSSTWRRRRRRSRRSSRSSASPGSRTRRTASSGASSSRSRSAATCSLGARAEPRRCTTRSTRARSSASTTTWARRRSRTSWSCASPTASSSRSGTATTSTTCRSPWPSRSASRAAAGYYEEAGALRDMVQNHMLQLLSFVAMEPPASFDAEAVRDESAKVLGVGAPDAHARTSCAASTRRASSDGEPVPGYVEEEGVARSLAHRDLRRRARLARQLALGGRAVLPAHRQAAAEARHRDRDPVQARAAPAVLLRGGRAARAERAGAAHPAGRGHLAALRRQGAARRAPRSAPSTWTSTTARRSPSPPAEAYEPLLLDAMRGDPTNFTRQDAVDRELARRRAGARGCGSAQAGAPHLYAAGTWGPDAADDLLARDGRRWRRP